MNLPSIPTELRIAGAVVALLALLTTMFLTRSCGRDELADPARERALTRCVTTGSAAVCEGLLERHHERCAAIAYHKPRGAQASFDEAAYQRCVELGPEGFTKHRREQQARQARDL